MSLGYEIGFGFSDTEPRCVFGGPKNAHSLTFGALGCEVRFKRMVPLGPRVLNVLHRLNIQTVKTV